MANLSMLFKRAVRELPNTGLRQTATQEVLELRDKQGHRVQGIAWRPLSNQQVLQFYPPTPPRRAFREGPHLVIKDHRIECRYYDPNCKLNPNQWSYVGCSNCSNLSDDVVWDWILRAYEYLRRDKGMKCN